MANAQTTGTAREATVGNQRTLLTHVHRLDIAGGIQHLLHAWSALGTFVSDNHAVAFLHFSTQNALTGIFLRVKDNGRTFEVPQTLVDTGGLHHTAVLRNITEEHSHAAIFGIGMFDVTNAAIDAVGIKRLPLSILRTQHIAELTSRSTVIDAVGFGVDMFFRNAVLLDVFTERGTIDTLTCEVKQVTLGEFAKNAENTTGTVLFLDAVFLPVRGELAEERHLAAQRIDILHLEVHLTLLRHSQQVKHRIGACTHGNVECHGIEECLSGSDAARQHALITILIIGKCVFDDEFSSIFEELDTVLVRSQNTAIARQRESDGLRQ